MKKAFALVLSAAMLFGGASVLVAATGPTAEARVHPRQTTPTSGPFNGEGCEQLQNALIEAAQTKVQLQTERNQIQQELKNFPNSPRIQAGLQAALTRLDFSLQILDAGIQQLRQERQRLGCVSN